MMTFRRIFYYTFYINIKKKTNSKYVQSTDLKIKHNKAAKKN